MKFKYYEIICTRRYFRVGLLMKVVYIGVYQDSFSLTNPSEAPSIN